MATLDCSTDDARTTPSSAEQQQQQQQQQQPTSPAEKLLLSFENPNYQLERQLKTMDQARIDDHLNSNIAPNMYEELCRELKIYTDLSGEGLENSKQNQRWNYAQLTAQSMGVLESPQTEKEVSCEKEEPPQPKETNKEGEKPDNLMEGWEMHEDEGGLYFWHIKTGTIQREIPTALKHTPRLTKSSTSSQISKMAPTSQPSTTSEPENSVTEKRKSLPPAASTTSPIDDPQHGMQVRVKALGSIQLSEESLTNENSSRAVNRCIVQLSTNETPVDGGKELILTLNEGTLRLLDPNNGSVVNSQPIHTIRVWGVGRDDGRDFAYVARDKATRCHTCHVFRCEVPARAIANRLRDICKKILIERSLTQSSSKLMEQESSGGSRKESASSRGSSLEDSASSTPPASAVPGASNLIRPTHFTTKLKTKTVSRAPDSFPTPMEEPKKIIKARFIGDVEVDKPGGMEVINQAIETCESRCPEADWALVNVGVAPSTITITFADPKRAPIDCRVRFLSFLGIGKDSRKCAFIVHTAQDTFVAYSFHCEPHSGPLCKTIEAACTLRYQKCLDARPQRLQSPSPLDSSSKKMGGGHDQSSGGSGGRQSHTTIKKALKTIFFGSSSTTSAATSSSTSS